MPEIQVWWAKEQGTEAARNTANLLEGTVSKVKDGSNLVEKTNVAFSQVSISTASPAPS